MCTYNGAEFLPAQWESILAQSRRPDEIVVCDDGSSDQSRSLLEKFAAESPIPVALYFNQTNRGSVKNFEQAIRLCKGEVIALSDQDEGSQQVGVQCLGKRHRINLSDYSYQANSFYLFCPPRQMPLRDFDVAGGRSVQSFVVR